MSSVVAIYHIDDEETPYRTKINVPSVEDVTLADFKTALNLPRSFKFFFASQDADFGLVKEEINDDQSKLPFYNGRVEAWLVTNEGSVLSEQTTKVSSNQNLNSVPKADSRPQSYNGGSQRHFLASNTQQKFVTAAEAFDQSACTSETESTLSGLPKFPRHGSKLDRRSYRPQYYDRGRKVPRNWPTPMEGTSALTSELESTTFLESEDDMTSRFSTSTDITSVSRQYMKNKRKKRRLPRTAISRASSVSSITESSMSLNIITVTLNLETNKFLGLSIVGHSNQLAGDGGIYVGTIMKGGAVALDGRIEPGDMILQVNDISFENVSNDEAVQILREVAHKSDSIKLVVAKCWDSNPKSYFTIPRTEPIRPIDPGAWVAHTNALRNGELQAPPSEFPARPSSASTTTTSNRSGSAPSTVHENEKYFSDAKLDVNVHDMQTIARAMARPDSGLTIKDRSWLKITIPNAFLGSDLVDWLHTHIQGFEDLKDARKYASKMLKEGFIKHTVNKITFASQCYYVFGDLYGNFATMRLEEPRDDSTGSSDHDTISPLLPPPPAPVSGWPPQQSAMGFAPSLGGMGLPSASTASGYAPVPSTVGTNNNVVFTQRNFMTGALFGSGVAPRSEVTSSSSGGSSGADRLKRRPSFSDAPLPPLAVKGVEKSRQHSSDFDSGYNPSSSAFTVPQKVSTHPNAEDGCETAPPSRQSFRIAMGNPCEFFVDTM